MVELKDDEVIIKKAVLADLEHDAQFLECLQNAGVDNWGGYSYAWELMRENYPEVE